MNLGHWPVATEGRVVSVDLDQSHRLRLGELGLRAGAVLRVTHRAAFGGRVVAIGADRFAVDAATCARIEMTEAAVSTS
jgi:ferrous iron transport protein A